jgi:hypothetical protein
MLSRIRRFILNKDEELETLAWLISVIDSYRVGMGVDMEGLREKVRTLPAHLRMENWTQVYKDMKEITDLPFEKEPSTKRWINIFAFLRYLVKQAFLIIGVILFVFLLTMRLPFITTAQLQYILYVIVAVIWIVVVVRAYAKDKLKMFYYRHQKDYKKNEERLQKAAQSLIDKMGKSLTEKGANPKKYSFTVYQRDYTGITVLKKPNLLKDYYTIAVKQQ